MQTIKCVDPLLSFINKNCHINLNKYLSNSNNNNNNNNNDVPEALAPISWLEGTWRSVKGVMDHPNIKVPFLFDEIVSFTTMGQKPIYYYTSVATNPKENNALLHLEVGHLMIHQNQIGLLLVHKFGCTTIEEGLLKHDSVIELSSTEIGPSKFIKKPLYGTYRIYALNKHGQLTYKLALANDPGNMIDYIWCTYEKRSDCD